MASIYTCPYCRRRYTIYHEGDYLCDCGRIFFYPPLLASEKANFVTLSPTYLDSASKSVRRTFRASDSARRRAGGRDCPLARASLICGILGLLFFGITSLPGLLLGIAGRIMIADPYYHYRGEGMALTGIVLSVVGAIAWSVWFCSQL